MPIASRDDTLAINMSELQVSLAVVGEVTVVALVGEGAAGNVRQLETAITRLSAVRPRTVVLDLTRLSFVASLCMGCFVALHRSIATHGGMVRIAGVNEEVATALRRAKLNAIFPMDATVCDAVAAST
jgi:anti-anti-sigma factor